MSSSAKNLAIGVLALASVTLGVVAFRLNQELAAQRALVAQTATARDALQKRLAEADRRLTDVEKDRTASDTELNKLREQSAAAAPREARRNNANPMAMLDNPAMQKMMATNAKASLDARYASLFRKLKLNPQQLDKLKDLLTERQMSAMDVMRAAQQQGLNPRSNGAEIASLVGTAQKEIDENIRELLGDSGYSTYESFNQNIGAHGVLDQLAQRLSYTSTPLSESQTESLLGVIAQNSPQPPDSAMAGMAMFGGGNPMIAALGQPAITDQTIAAAQSVLDSSQIAVLKQLQSEQQAQREAMQAMRGVRPPAPPN